MKTIIFYSQVSNVWAFDFASSWYRIHQYHPYQVNDTHVPTAALDLYTHKGLGVIGGETGGAEVGGGVGSICSIWKEFQKTVGTNYVYHSIVDMKVPRLISSHSACVTLQAH